MPRRVDPTKRNDTTGTVANNTIQMSSRVRPEQDMIITMVSRMKGVDKSVVVSSAIDMYISSLPAAVITALVHAAAVLSEQPELELVTQE